MKSAMCRIVMVLAICICLIYSAQAGPELPTGYKAIVFSEKDSVEWRHDDKNLYLQVKADFNGDGVIDEARLLRGEDDARIALFCFLKDKDGNFTTFKLHESNDPFAINYLGIEEAKAGMHLTAAGKGYGAFEGESKSIELKNPAVNLFNNEGSSQFFYWDDSAKTFKNVCTSD